MDGTESLPSPCVFYKLVCVYVLISLFFKTINLFMYLCMYVCMYLFIFGCIGSSLLCVGFL